MVVVTAILLTVLGAILYRLGGSVQTKYRDVGVPLCVLALVAILGGWHWSMLVSAVLMFGAMTQYWKASDRRVMAWHWFTTGLMYAVSWLPFCYFNHSIKGFSLYAMAVSILTVVIAESIGDDVWEELLRGGLVIACAPLLMLK